MNIIIVGCNALGRSLATTLSGLGNEIAIIDSSRDALDLLPTDFSGIAVEGEAIDIEVLEAAGIKDCSAMAVVTENDNLNIVVTQLASKKYKIDNVVAIVSDPQRESVYEMAGLKTICPTKTSSAAITDVLLKSEFSRRLNFGINTAKFEYTSGKPFAGHRVADVSVTGYLLFAITDASGKTYLSSEKNRIVQESDKLIFASLID